MTLQWVIEIATDHEVLVYGLVAVPARAEGLILCSIGRIQPDPQLTVVHSA